MRMCDLSALPSPWIQWGNEKCYMPFCDSEA